MNRILLPHSDIRISQAIFGTSRLGGTIERYDKQEALAVLRTAAESGITCFDTADIYGQGNGERLIAEAFGKNREHITIATKGGYVLSEKGRLLAKIKPIVRRFLKSRPGLLKAAGKARGSQMRQDFSPAHLQSAIEASLKRLRTDRIDLYQLHSPDPSTLASGEVFETLAKLKQAGKIRAFGASLLNREDLRHCHGHGLSWVQIDGALFSDNAPETLCREARDSTTGAAIIARQAFGSGLLSRPITSWTPEDFSGDPHALNTARKRVTEITAAGDPFAILLRYLAHHSPFDGFLLATTRLENLRKNLAALAMPPFSTEEAALLASLLKPS